MKLANEPFFSRGALRDYTGKAGKGGNNKRSIKQNVEKIKMEEKCGDAKDGDGEFKKGQCPVCDENHDLGNCSMFKDQTLEERSKMLRKKKLCYGYYSPVSQDHNAKTGKQRITCMICKQSHPTGLHVYLPKKKHRKNFLRTQCSAIAVKVRSSKKTFRKNLEQLAGKLILQPRLLVENRV